MNLPLFPFTETLRSPTEYSFGMAADTPFPGDPGDSREAIMRATYLALKEYGYAGLSIQRIADEAELSKSTFYHHYDDKHDLLTAFVEFVLTEFTRVFSLEASDDPLENFNTYVDIVLDPESADGLAEPSPTVEILGTYVELRAQAVQDETFREKFTDVDHAFEQQLTGIIEECVEAGVFRDVDPEATAMFVSTYLAGHSFRSSTRADVTTSTVRAEFQTYVQQSLLRSDA